MSNTNNNLQTQTSNTLHNDIMEAGSKDRPPMLAPGNYVQWKSRIKRYIDSRPNPELIHYCLKNPPYELGWKEIQVPVSEGSLETRPKKLQEMYKNVSQDIRDQLNAEAKASQELKTVLYHKLYDILKQHQNEINEIRAEKIARVANPLALVAQQQPVYNPQNHPTHYTQNSSTRSQQTATRNKGKAIVNSPQLIYDQEPYVVAEDDETSKDKEIDKLMALISLSFKKIYNLPTTIFELHLTPIEQIRIILQGLIEELCMKIKEQADWKDDTDDESDDQELEAHYMYMAKLQGVFCPDVADSGPIFDTEEVQKVSTNDHYNVFAIESEHPEQSKTVHDTYHIEQDEHNVIIDSLDMSYDSEQIDQNDDNDDLVKERELLTSLIEKLKCEIDESKKRNKFLETSNMVLVDKLKGEIEDFKNKNKSLELSNNQFKKANNKLSEINNLLYADFKKSQAKLKRRDSTEYASEMELECAKVRGDFISYKINEKQAFCTLRNHIYTYTAKRGSDREDKELEKVIVLKNKVKVLDNIVYKTDQSVQTMNMLNNKCRTSFAKPEFLKKAQRANPRLYDIGCYNDNLALMLAPESDEVIHLEKEKRSRLSYTIVNNGNLKKSFNKQTTLLEKRMDESIPLDKQCRSSLELFKVKMYVNKIFKGVELCKESIAKRTYFGYVDPFVKNTIEGNFCPEIQRIQSGLHQFHRCLNEEMVADLRYFNSLEFEVDSLRSQLVTRKTQFLNEIDRLSREYYYADHMNTILGVYTELDEVTNLQCDYLELLEKCKCLEKELSKSKTISKSFESVQKHAINLKLELQQCKEKIKNDKLFKANHSNNFWKERKQYVEIQDLKAQLQEKGIAIRVIPTTSISRPQLKSNPMEVRVMLNNSQGKKQEVEDHRRNVKFSKNKTSVTACNDSLNAKTLNENFVCATCGKCVLNEKHDMCILKSDHVVNSKTKMPVAMPVSTRETKRTVNQSVEKPIRKTVDSESNQKPRNSLRKLYEHVKENQEKDKIRSKPDKNGKRGEAEKSLKQMQLKGEEKPKKTKKEWPKTHT
nr:hypothetical protein [Tanacetum cinerariifolium]